jgi:hypothetical protein
VRREGTYQIGRLGYAPQVSERAARHKLPTFGTKADPLTGELSLRGGTRNGPEGSARWRGASDTRPTRCTG